MNTKLIIAATALALFSCQKKNTEVTTEKVVVADSVASAPAVDSANNATTAGDTSQNALDWAGTYETTLPCADCPGIKTTLTLNKDNTFKITEEYLEKKAKYPDQGTFAWNKEGNIITLNGKDVKYKYKVGENKLTQLDLDGKEINNSFKDLYVYKKK